MRITSSFGLTAAAFGIALACSAPASADVILPAPNCGPAASNNCLQFSDFSVYSLALLNLQQGAGQVGPGDPFDVSTNGQALQNAIVIGTGVNGAGSFNTDTVGNNADRAYATPTAAGGGINNYLTNAGTERLPEGSLVPASVQSPNTWDINISALNGYLNGGKLVFFFNLNQTNSQSTTFAPLFEEDALGWMKVTLTNSSLNPGDVGYSASFLLDGNNCTGIGGRCGPGSFLPQSVDPSAAILPNPGDQWAWIHGEICASNAGAFLHGGPCTGADGAGVSTLKQNLGADDAAFALYSVTLQTALNSGLYDVMSVDFRMGALTNGYEQLLIFSSNSIPQNVPEPATIAIFGVGLAGAALWRRRRKV
jgi:hypothetical protein